MEKRDSNQPKFVRGLFGKYDSEPPTPPSRPGKLTWFTNFAPIGIQFRYWFFILAAIAVAAFVFLYIYNPQKANLFKSIEVLNNAIMLTDAQGNGDYFSYWNDEIISKFEEGWDMSTKVGTNIFSYGSYETSMMFELYYYSMINDTKKSYDGYLKSRQIGETTEETEWLKRSGRVDMKIAKHDIRIWMDYWGINGETIKEAYNWK